MRPDHRPTETPATAWLSKQGIPFTLHPYAYVDHGGAGWAAEALGLDPRAVVKTLVMQDERARPLIILMHGDREVSTKSLARAIGAKGVQPCAPEVAQRHSGYLVGGTSPFALRKAMPVYVEAGVLRFDRIYINAGRRGLLLGIAPSVLTDSLGAVPVECAIDQRPG